MIDLDRLIVNMRRLDKNTGKILKNEIFNLFEPIMYQIVLSTRMDTGKSRASIGHPFTKKVIKSQRIIDAIDHDVEVNASAYYHWSNRSDVTPLTDYKGLANKLVKGNKVEVEIISYEQGLIDQEDGNTKTKDGRNKGLPSPFHPREHKERHKLHHINQIMVEIDHSQDLENFSSSGTFLPSVVKDIRNRVMDLTKRIEKELFR